MVTTNEAWCEEFKDIKSQLQKAFIILDKCLTAWQDADKICRGKVQSINNLTEQYQCATKVQTNTLPGMQGFADVKAKLLFKIGNGITSEIAQLEEHVMTLGEFSKSLSRQLDRCKDCSRRSTTSADVPALINKTAIYPSVAEMLEWLQMCDRGLMDSWLSKHYLIETFSPNTDTGGLEALWMSGDKQLITQIQSYLAYTDRFLELKLT